MSHSHIDVSALASEACPVVPPKVEYTLTAMAQDLHKSLLELTDWARRHGSAVAAAQAAYDREANS